MHGRLAAVLGALLFDERQILVEHDAVLAGEHRIVFDQDLAFVEEESAKHRRKAAMHDE